MHEVFESAARYFSVLAEPARLKILHTLCIEEKSVNAIIAATGMAQANASRHLGLMYQSGLLSRRREGTQVFYKVADRMLMELCRTVSVQIATRMGHEQPEQAFSSQTLGLSSALVLSNAPVVPNGRSNVPLPSNQKEKTSV